MMTFAYPWLFALLPLPLAIVWWWPAKRVPRPALQIPFMDRLARVTGTTPARGASIAHGVVGRKFVMPLVWLCVVAALARPQWIEPPVTKNLPMRDLLLAVDLSGSMATTDFTTADGKPSDRLTAVKGVLDDFLTRRKGDRIGLVFFGSAPFVQAPFTEDIAVCRELLGEAQVKMAGPQTAFGDAIGLAINLFDHSEMKDRVLIALTDGNDTASQVTPQKAAEIAHEKGIVIHTVSVGDPKAAGEDALDVATLESVAKTTGGIYSAASDRRQLDGIYQKLDTLEPRRQNTISHRPKRDVYFWPLAAGFFVSLIYQAVLLALRAGGRMSAGVERKAAA